MVSRWEDRSEEDNHGMILTTISVLSRETGWNSQKLRRVLTRLEQVQLIKITPKFTQSLTNLQPKFDQSLDEVRTKFDETFELFIPKWSKFQETRGARKLKKNVNPPLDIELEERIKNKREKAPSPPAHEFDFEALYQKYPRKAGKGPGIATCKRVIKTQEDYQLLDRAITNYAISVQGSEEKYIKHFESFMNKERWKDYINPTGRSLPQREFYWPQYENKEKKSEGN